MTRDKFRLNTPVIEILFEAFQSYVYQSLKHYNQNTDHLRTISRPQTVAL
jgi:hypothetical protein